MWDIEPRKVLVGVESIDCEAALQYAVEDAVRRRCGIHLAHVAHLGPPSGWTGDEVSLVEGELRRSDELVLAAAQARAQVLLHDLAPGDDELAVSTELTHGRVVAVLSSLSTHASRLVVQHEHTGALSGAFSVSADLVERAGCPVVVVPRSWRAAAQAAQAVVAGVDDLARAAALIAIADQEAVARGTRLRVVVAGPGAEGDLPVTESAVDLVVATGPLEDALLHEAMDAALLVIGPHRRGHRAGTALSLLDRSRLPLLLVEGSP